MEYQKTFRRYELKYLITSRQKEIFLNEIVRHLSPDKYGSHTVRNIYFDTDNFILARRSLEKPVYKEKLRVRSYREAGKDDPVFVELKKKYKSVVYKRRLTLPQDQAMESLCRGGPLPTDSQIADEINYFCQFYHELKPKLFMSYGRETYIDRGGGDLRITFDEDILYREDDLSLESRPYGRPVMGEDQVLMEIKTSGGMPLWMSGILTEQKLYRTSFSKYGRAYEEIISAGRKGADYHD